MFIESLPLLIGPSDGTPTMNPIGGQMVRKIADTMTHAAYSIHDNILPGGSPGPRPHRHLHHDEVFYVLDGTLTVRVESQRFTAEAGSFVVIPRGSIHQPSNPSTTPTHVLLLFSPGGMDQFFLEVAALQLPLQAVPIDPAVQEALDAFTNRYGYEFATFDEA